MRDCIYSARFSMATLKVSIYVYLIPYIFIESYYEPALWEELGYLQLLWE